MTLQNTSNKLFAIGVEYEENIPIIYGTVFPEKYLSDDTFKKQNINHIFLETT